MGVSSYMKEYILMGMCANIHTCRFHTCRLNDWTIMNLISENGLRSTDHRFSQLIKSSLDPGSAPPPHVKMPSYVLGPVALWRGV